MSTKASCPVCKLDCKNPTNLASHLRAKHPDYLKPDKPAKKARAEQQREWVTRATRESSASIRDISPLPPVADPARRARCAASLLVHCRTYYPAKFTLPFSPVHLKVIAKLERAVLKGGVFAVAMPRGSGKSELAKRAAEWAVLNGHRRFVVLLGATQELAEGLLADIQAQLESNDDLAADYPEACYPVRRLEHIVQRAKGQTFSGAPTKIEWAASQVRLAQIPGSICSGATIRAEGLTGALRGMSVPGPDGETWRPDLVVPDDPQTTESATSQTQIRTRERIINGDVLGLAGPTKSIACLMPCTVIARGDLADQLLDRQKNPHWQGEKSRLVEAFPTDELLWTEYFRLRREDFEADAGAARARAFYEKHRADLDAGAVMSWPERYDANAYASAVEEAMCIRHDRPAAFAAEMQNEPLEDTDIAAGSLSAATLADKSSNQPRGLVPREATRLTAGVDVGGKCLFWAVTAWSEDFGGAVVDYGVWPRQNRAYFAASDARPAMEDQYPGLDETARVYAGLRDLTGHILGRAYQREGGGEVKVDRCLVDSGWQTDTVYQACKQSQFASVLLPSKGYGITASAPPMSTWAWKPGQRGGKFWRLSPQTASGRGRLCLFDANYWKSFVTSRLATPAAGLGCLYLPGGDNGHIIDHLTAEYKVTVTADKQGRKVDEWKLRPTHTDNHWLDAVALTAVAAQVDGLRWNSALAAAVRPGGGGGEGNPAAPPPSAKPKKRVDLAAIARQRGYGATPAGAFGGF